MLHKILGLLLALLPATALASFSVIGQAENSVPSASLVSTLQTSATLNVALHDRLEIIVYAETPNTPTLSDTGGDTFSFITSFQPQTNYRFYVYEVLNAAANSADYFTATATSAQLVGIAVLQVRGLNNSTAAAYNNTGQGDAPGTDAITGGMVTPTAQPSAVIGFNGIITNYDPGQNMVSTVGTGFTAQTGIWTILGGGAGDYMGAFETKEVTILSPVAATWTQTSNNQYNTKGSVTLVIPEVGASGASRAPSMMTLGVG